MDQATIYKYLKSVYYDPKRSGSFGGIESLHRDVKQEGKFKLGRKQISDWLMSEGTYTLQKIKPLIDSRLSLKQEVEKELKRDLPVRQRNAKHLVKRERHQRLPSEAFKPRSEEQLVQQIYSVKDEFRTFKVAGMHKK